MLDVHLILFHLSLSRCLQVSLTRGTRSVRYLLVCLCVPRTLEQDVPLGLALVRQVHRLLTALNIQHLGAEVPLRVDQFPAVAQVTVHFVPLNNFSGCRMSLLVSRRVQHRFPVLGLALRGRLLVTHSTSRLLRHFLGHCHRLLLLLLALENCLMMMFQVGDGLICCHLLERA